MPLSKTQKIKALESLESAIQNAMRKAMTAQEAKVIGELADVSHLVRQKIEGHRNARKK